MKTISAEALAALAKGEAIVSGAVRLGTAEPRLYWGGYGEVTLGGEVYEGIGDRGLVTASGGSLGGQEQPAEITVSGLDPDAAGDLNLRQLRGVSAVLWRLVFNGSGSTLLDASVFLRGRVDRATIEETPGGNSTLRIAIEGAARGLGRRSERMRTDSDQRLILPTDGGMRRIAWAGEKSIYWGGKPPQRAGSAFSGGTVIDQLRDVFNINQVGG